MLFYVCLLTKFTRIHICMLTTSLKWALKSVYMINLMLNWPWRSSAISFCTLCYYRLLTRTHTHTRAHTHTHPILRLATASVSTWVLGKSWEPVCCSAWCSVSRIVFQCVAVFVAAFVAVCVAVCCSALCDFVCNVGCIAVAIRANTPSSYGFLRSQAVSVLEWGWWYVCGCEYGDTCVCACAFTCSEYAEMQYWFIAAAHFLAHKKALIYYYFLQLWTPLPSRTHVVQVRHYVSQP